MSGALPAGAAPVGEEDAAEAVRPRSLGEFVGQGDVVRRLKMVLAAARSRGEPPDHLLFAGPPGLGKTTLAGIVAHETGARLRVTSGPALARPGDLAAALTALRRGDVLFVDEIHRLSRPVEEILYPAMEDCRLDTVIGRGPSAKTVSFPLERFTLVGATTRTGLLSAPLQNRFGFVAKLEHYSVEELAAVVSRSARIFGLVLGEGAAGAVGERSRGTPRIANRLLRRVQDWALSEGASVVGAAEAQEALLAFGVDALGLDPVDREILDALCARLAGAPVGVVSLAQMVGEEPSTLVEVYEPFLVRQGLVARTPRGRQATARAFAHLGLAAPAGRGGMEPFPVFAP